MALPLLLDTSSEITIQTRGPGTRVDMTVTASDLIDAPTPTPSEAAVPHRPLRILTFTSLFPNVSEPWRGASVRDRVRAIARLAEVEVMAPVPWLPNTPGLLGRPHPSHRVPRLDSHQTITIHHPRFLVRPHVLKAAEPAFLVLSCAPALLMLRRRFRFDLLDAGSAWPDGVAAGALAALIGVPFAVTVCGDDVKVFEQDPGRRLLIRCALRRAALVITHSQELQSRVVALGVPESRAAVIPDGVDVERFCPLDRETARACLGIPSSARLLLTVGRLRRSKGLAILVDALGRLAGEDPELRLVIVGDPDPEANATPEIRAAIARSGLLGRVTLVSERSPRELVWWYNAADLFCLVTTGHESAHALFEAMACGVPFVTTEVAGNRGMIADERFGMLAAADSASLAHAIDVALKHWWDRDGIARQAQSRGWDVVGRGWCARVGAIGALQELPS